MNLKIDRVIRIGLNSDKYDDLKRLLDFTHSNLTEIWLDKSDMIDYSIELQNLLGINYYANLAYFFTNEELDYIAIYLDY